MLRIIRKIHPSIIPTGHIVLGYFYDMYKFIRTSSNFVTNKRRLQLESVLYRQYHGVEKGLSFEEPRMGFGQLLVGHFINNLEFYYKNYGYDNLVKICSDILLEYRIYHKDYDELDFKQLDNKIEELLTFITEFEQNGIRKGGVKIIIKKELLSSLDKFDFEAFSNSRYSIRDFNKKTSVPIEKIRRAIEIAGKTPSACNRQAWKVHVFKDEKKELVLNYQNGNRGFRDSIDTVLLITGLSSSFSYSERHGALVDGGLFSMSLLYALHSLGLGTCPLNTGYTFKDELKLRKAINLNLHEEPIMMIAIGELREEFTVANSSRKEVGDLMVIE
tara:strand:- start:9456 stop:10448 length:993 start_codon:yes stop_codon:yes gene_type:complete